MWREGVKEALQLLFQKRDTESVGFEKEDGK